MIARETTYIYSLQHQDFSKILDSYPTVKEKMALIAEERLAETQKVEAAVSSDSEPEEDESKVFPWPSFQTDELDTYESFETPILTIDQPESNTSVPVFTFNLETPSDEHVKHTSDSV